MKRIVRQFSFLERFRPKQIGRQIGYGYLAAILVGWVGSLSGIILADYFQGRGILQFLDAQTQSSLFVRFEETVNHAQIHATRAIISTNNIDETRQALLVVNQDLIILKGLQQELDTFLNSQPSWTAQDAETLQVLFATYIRELNQQQEEIELAISRNDISVNFSQVLSKETRAKLDRLQADLSGIISIAQSQETLAADVMESAQGLEKLIVISSITVAGLLAGVIAWRTTLAISIPVENITQVARKVTYEGDYTARSTIFYDDEVGILAQSLNELIERVAERTDSLKQAAQTAVSQRQELEDVLKNLRTAQLQLVQAEKMSSLGQLVAGIAHEINNPISFIHGNLTYIKEYSNTLFKVINRLQAELPEIPNDLATDLKVAEVEFIRRDLPRILRSINNGTERISSLILSLRVFSRLQESQRKVSNLNEGLESTLLLLSHRLKSQAKRPEVHVVRRYADLPKVECFSSEMNQVFMNIMNNALDAIDERWASTPATWEPTLIISSKFHQDHICIQIYNNGLPIPESVQSKIFDPFFTTKPLGKGTGLGMSITYEIVHKKHQGKITFISPVLDNMGTQFSIQIPAGKSLSTPSYAA